MGKQLSSEESARRVTLVKSYLREEIGIEGLRKRMGISEKYLGRWIRAINAANGEQIDALRSNKISIEGLMGILGIVNRSKKNNAASKIAAIVRSITSVLSPEMQLAKLRLVEQYIAGDINRERLDREMGTTRLRCNQWINLYLSIPAEEKSAIRTGDLNALSKSIAKIADLNDRLSKRDVGRMGGHASAQARRKKSEDDPRRAMTVELGKDGTMSEREISEKTGASKASVHRWLKAAGLGSGGTSGRPRRSKYSRADKDRVLELVKNGYSYRRISKEIGMSKAQISRVVQDAGLKVKQGGRASKDIPTKQISSPAPKKRSSARTKLNDNDLIHTALIRLANDVKCGAFEEHGGFVKVHKEGDDLELDILNPVEELGVNITATIFITKKE